ncbi:unnamed protein product, partial [Polarella glacialis]
SDPFEELLDPSHGPAVIRHNRTFAVPRVPDGGAGWLPPNRPLLASYNYHDMVCETIYMKGSKDMQRAQQYMDSKQQREEERMAWSSDRFRRQRATTKLFADMQETFGEILGKPAAPPWPKEEALVAEDFADRSDAGSSKSAPRRRHGRAPGVFSPATSQDFFKEEHGSQTPSEGSRQAPRSAAFMKRSSTAPGLLPGPFKQSSCLTGYTARSPASGSPLKMVKGKSQDVVWPGGWKPEQSPGDRGLPSQYVSAKCMPGGSAMYWPRDRSFGRS